MIEHRHVWITFYSTAQLNTLRVNGHEGKYEMRNITFSSRVRLERVLKNYTPVVSLTGEQVFWDAIKEK